MKMRCTRRGKRNPGKQPGAPGSYLAWTCQPAFAQVEAHVRELRGV